MGFRGLLTAAAVVLVTSWEVAVGSSRLDTHVMVQQPDNIATGLCAASVLIHGYKCKEFHVTTDDGYILSVQRIPEGRSGGGSGAVPKQPVLLQHGFLVDGSSWVLNSAEESLPMILADNGFDVWIVNTRGTVFSRRHVYLNTLQRQYWDWSWDEIAAHDLPAAIDFVYNNAGKQKINYIGHSLGTLVALTYLSEQGNQIIHKLRSASLLSPIAYLSHMKTALANLAARSLLAEAYKFLGIAEFDPLGYPVKEFVRLICSKPGIRCFDLLAAITGKNCCLNTSTIDIYLKSEPQPTATKNIIHLAQTVRTGILSKYDYGNAFSNFRHYAQFTPPVYNLANIPRHFPLFLSHGGNDYLSDTEDVKKLLYILKDHDTDKIAVQYVENYGHVDFVLGLTAKNVVFNQVVAFINKPF